jgi:hypothetical protein
MEKNNLKFITYELNQGHYLQMEAEFIRYNIEDYIGGYKILVRSESVDAVNTRTIHFIIYKEATRECYEASITLTAHSKVETTFAIKLKTSEEAVKCEYVHFGLSEHFNVEEQFKNKLEKFRVLKYTYKPNNN